MHNFEKIYLFLLSKIRVFCTKYNNRWFGLCLNKKQYYTLALDRMMKISEEDTIDYVGKNISGDVFYKNVFIGQLKIIK
jgi:hypothetical protein